MTTSVTVALDGRTFTARLVQPTGVAPRAYPIVAFGHGFVQSRCQHQSTLAALAARGYIVIAPDSEGSFFPDHARFAADLTRAIRWVRATQPNAHATLDAVAGHSMGGGAALLAADADPAIESIATLAAAETRPSATSAAAGITAPALFVVGSQDRIVAPATTRAMYDAKLAAAVWASISGWYHCGSSIERPSWAWAATRGRSRARPNYCSPHSCSGTGWTPPSRALRRNRSQPE